MATVEAATLGAGIGSIIPGVGTVVGGVVGGIIGAGIDIFNFLSGTANKASAETVQRTKDIATAGAQLTEYQTKASAYEDFLAKVPIAGETLQGTTGDLAFDQQYRALLENYGNVNVLAGVTGRVGAGTTGAEIGKQAGDIMGGFVSAEKQKAQAQLTIYGAGIESTQTGLTAMQDVQKKPDFLTGLGNWLSGKGWTG